MTTHLYKSTEGSIDFKLDSEIVKINNNNLIINQKRYIRTEGLLKFLTLKNPEALSTIIKKISYYLN